MTFIIVLTGVPQELSKNAVGVSFTMRGSVVRCVVPFKGPTAISVGFPYRQACEFVLTTGTATGHAAWARRAAEHPQVIEALAEGHLLSESVARTICTWTDKLPADCRVAADAILIVAAKTGADVRGLAEVFGGIYTLARPRPGLVPAPEPAVISAVAI